MSSTKMLHGFKVPTFQNSKKAYETYKEINTNYIGEKENSKETLSQRNQRSYFKYVQRVKRKYFLRKLINIL